MNKRTMIKEVSRLILMCSFILSSKLFAPPITVTVTTNADAFPVAPAGSLREAINLTNANTGFTNTIEFDLLAGPIVPVVDLPSITNPVIINGCSEDSGATPNTNVITSGNNANLTVVIQGPGAGTDIAGPLNGLTLAAGSDGSTISCLVINNFAKVLSATLDFGAGINIQSNNNTISGNFIGTNAAGDTSVPNATAIRVDGNNNLIGGIPAEARNLLSGHYLGGSVGSLRNNGVMRIAGADTTVQQNTIGLDRSGTITLMPDATKGIAVVDATGTTTIGGSDHVEDGGNVIAGHSAANIYTHSISGDLIVDNNYIGTNVAGTAAALTAGSENHNGNGIIAVLKFDDIPLKLLIQNNVISGGTYGIQLGNNVTSYAIRDAVIIDNLIGLNAAGTAAIPNSRDGIWIHFAQGTYISGNTISGNLRNGIRLGKSKSTTIKSNFIGTDVSGEAAIGNGANGIQLGTLVAAGVPAFGDTVGGAKAGEANVIANNGKNGIEMVSFAREETIVGNTIRNNEQYGIAIQPYPKTNYMGIWRDAGDHRFVGGVSTQGGSNLGPLGTSNEIIANGLGGIFIDTSHYNTMQTNIIQENDGNGITEQDASFNVVGGKVGAPATTVPPVLGNVITDNDGFGVQVIQDDGYATDNTIISNQIVNNTSNGIQLTTL